MSPANSTVDTIAPWSSRQSYSALPAHPSMQTPTQTATPCPVCLHCSRCSPGVSFIHVGAWPLLLLAPPRSPQPLPRELRARGGSLRSPKISLVQGTPVHCARALRCRLCRHRSSSPRQLTFCICFFHFAPFICFICCQNTKFLAILSISV